ncbi:uridine kinase family protein [Ornithinibacillus halotolerans]|uniref:Uridine kinase n=1 Tax=Ornithinibacillus halotolerans TaxID=1274357 RepID=A0A916S3D7_9BACI|nr:phosphoribulokinase [Ornithinibacillus halotolerans]GGA80834.1 uridine kinase [Ornithinibacillus halotolerans]
MEELLQQLVKYIRKHNEKLIIGISGHGASGKTTFATKLMELLEQDVTYMNTDPYIDTTIRKYSKIEYEYEGESYLYKMTACHPGAHHTLALARDITMLRDGLDMYTIGTHYRESELISASRNVIIIEGMSVAFVDPSLFDLKIFLYTDGDTEFSRRTVRDVEERGANISFLNDSHKQRRIQYELFMHHYHENFDIVVNNSNDGFKIERNSLSI